MTDPTGVWTIVLAAGASRRFGDAKQFVAVEGITLLDRAVDGAARTATGVVAVTPEGSGWSRDDVAAVVTGGRTRSRSVRRGLAAIPNSAEIIVIHDAAHPLAPPHLFDAVISAVRAGADAAVPGLPVAEALRTVDDGWMDEDIDRSGTVHVQMPQAFRATALRRVHAQAPETVEDSWLVRVSGGSVRVVPGAPSNVHVTTAPDLELVRAVVRARA